MSIMYQCSCLPQPNPTYSRHTVCQALLGLSNACVTCVEIMYVSKEVQLAKNRSFILKSHRLQRVWGRISKPQAASERKLKNFKFLHSLFLRLAQGVKVQGFNYRSLRPTEIVGASNEYYNPQGFLPSNSLSKICYRYMVNRKLFKHGCIDCI